MRAITAATWLVVLSVSGAVEGGDMTATLKSGVLTIKDSSADDSFTIDQAALMTTNFRLTPDPGTTINGSGAAQVFSGVSKDVKLAFTSGTDAVELDDVTVARDLVVTGGKGTQVSVVIANGLDVGRDLRVDSKTPVFSLSSTGTGNLVRRDVKCDLRGTTANTLVFTPLHVLRNTIVKGSKATDVMVVGANVQLVGNLTFDVGAGNDTFVDTNTIVVGGNFKMTGKAGTKTCVATGKYGGNLTTDLGNGDGNVLVCTAPNVGGSLRAKFGTGTNNVLTVSGTDVTDGIECTSKGNQDTVTIANTGTGSDVRIKLADGTNVVTVTGSSVIGGDIRMTGGNGVDNFGVNASSTFGDIKANFASAPTGFTDAYNMLLGSVGGDVSVTAGAGSFGGAIEDVTVVGGVKLHLGSGDNAYTLDGGVFGSVDVTTGAGNDTFTLTGGTIEVVADVRLLLGSGNNSMPIAHTTVGRDLIVKTGNGGDTISIATTTIIGTQSIDLGGGMNSGP
ncbi:MAG: hypothetical protein IPH13_08965 [Planctomycetes bacterium]|nr:hypothetical protein [Planctomycetota bacterium]MCC7172265.1 hypothetical protein [Planctomycetota bacterium]